MGKITLKNPPYDNGDRNFLKCSLKAKLNGGKNIVILPAAIDSPRHDILGSGFPNHLTWTSRPRKLQAHLSNSVDNRTY